MVSLVENSVSLNKLPGPPIVYMMEGEAKKHDMMMKQTKTKAWNPRMLLEWGTEHKTRGGLTQAHVSVNFPHPHPIGGRQTGLGTSLRSAEKERKRSQESCCCSCTRYMTASLAPHAIATSATFCNDSSLTCPAAGHTILSFFPFAGKVCSTQ